MWVEGDNPDKNKTHDSDAYGPIPISLIVGQVRAIVSPWRQAGWVSYKDYGGSPRVVVGKHQVPLAEVY